MSYSRKRPHAGLRCPGHDYSSRCIYHIVLNKDDGIPLFSQVVGEIGSHDNPPAVKLSGVGTIIANCLSELKKEFPFVSILRRCIMPDHVHISLFVREKTNTYLGYIIAEFKRNCSRGYEMLGYGKEIDLFIPKYHDTILFGRNQLQKMLDYISDNPRRHLMRLQNPGWFRNFRIGRDNYSYDAYGNWDLLYEFQRIPVKFSRKFSKQEVETYKRLWYKTILNDGILVSPFIHPEEKNVRDWAIHNGGVIILITYEPFPDRFKPSGKMFDLCAEGRLLIVSIDLGPEEDEYLKQKGKPSAFTCRRMNDLALEIATRDFHVL